jgi:hypothetical protein
LFPAEQSICRGGFAGSNSVLCFRLKNQSVERLASGHPTAPNSRAGRRDAGSRRCPPTQRAGYEPAKTETKLDRGALTKQKTKLDTVRPPYITLSHPVVGAADPGR